MELTCCLIVDDHEPLRNLLTNWLKSLFPDLHFIDAPTGEAALDLSRRYHPQIILMDIGLPGMNGLEAARQIKKELPRAYVIMHTIYDEQAYRLDAAESGADAFVVKSKSQSDLIPVINKALSIIENQNGKSKHPKQPVI